MSFSTALHRKRPDAAPPGVRSRRSWGLSQLLPCSARAPTPTSRPAPKETPPARQLPEEITTLRLGYFPNFTHAPALVGIQEGFFKDALAEQELTVTPNDLQRRP